MWCRSFQDGDSFCPIIFIRLNFLGFQFLKKAENYEYNLTKIVIDLQKKK